MLAMAKRIKPSYYSLRTKRVVLGLAATKLILIYLVKDEMH